MDQDKVGEAIGLSRTMLHYIKTGKHNVTAKVESRLAAVEAAFRKDAPKTEKLNTEAGSTAETLAEVAEVVLEISDLESRLADAVAKLKALTSKFPVGR